MKLSKLKLSVLFSAIALLAVFVSFQMVKADTGSNAYGYAWSSNIGWISLNDCTNVADDSTCAPAASYGVTVLPIAPGTISGYAWSSNIGWITFNNSGCPVSGCTPGAYATWSGDGSAAIHGWARACSVYDSGCSGSLKNDSYLGSWDGYIALDSVSGGGTAGTWGLTIGSDRKTIGGFAWGSEVIGWVKSITGSVYLDGPTAQLAANPVSIKNGENSVLTVTATNIDGANACSIVPAGSSTIVPGLTLVQSGTGVWTGTVNVSPASTTTYTVTCSKGSQTAKANATVMVTYIKTPVGGGGIGGYCAITYPQFAWDSSGTSCSISEQNVGSVSVDPNSKDYGGTLGTDGFYYAAINLPVSGKSATYTFQCTGGSKPNLQIVVNACQQDYSLGASAISSTFTVPQGGDGKTMTATYSITVTPQPGFVSPVALSVTSYPPTMPKSTTFTFSPNPVTLNGGVYTTSVLTITVNTADLKKAATYSSIVIQGLGNGITRTAQITANSAVKITPVFKEF
jgi:hypothetical protein